MATAPNIYQSNTNASGIDSPAIVQFPTGHVVKFPSFESAQENAVSVHQQLLNLPPVNQPSLNMETSTAGRAYGAVNQHLAGVGDTLLREGKAALSSVTGIPSALYHAAADPETADESQRFGKNFEKNIGPTGRVLDRMAVQPILNALSDYRDGKVTYDNLLSVLPEALGGSAGAVITGKAAADAATAFPKTLTPGRASGASVPSAAPAAAVPEPLSVADRSAAGYLRTLRAEEPSGVIRQGGVNADTASSERAVNIGGRTQAAHTTVEGANASATPSASEVNRFIRQQFGDSAPQVSLGDEERSASHLASASRGASQDIDAQTAGFLARLEREAVPTVPNETPKTEIDLTPELKKYDQQTQGLELARQDVRGGSDATAPTAPTVPTFFSKLERVAADKVPNSASGDQILATLRNNGVKENEIDWTGVDDFLKGKAKISKADLQDYISENKIQLEEKTFGQRTPEQQQAIDDSKSRVLDAQIAFNKVTSPVLEKLHGIDPDAARVKTSLISDEIRNGSRAGSRSSGEVLHDALDPARIREERLRGEYDKFVQEWRDRTNQPNANPYDKATGADKEQLLNLSDAINQAYHQKGTATNYVPDEVAQAGRDLFNTKEDLRKVQKVNQLPTRYESYTLPGEKSNYSEMLLKLPEQSPNALSAYSKRYNEISAKYGGATGPELLSKWTPEESAELNRLATSADRTASGAFKSSHFDDPNILAHVRFDDRPALDGKKTLFLEELQSDWHAKGKKLGYASDWEKSLTPEEKELKTYNAKTWQSNTPLTDAELKRAAELQNKVGVSLQEKASKSGGVPNAPFKSDWHELVMKRMLRHAAEYGYDRLAWTTGEQQAERYDLSKQIQSVEYYPHTQTLEAYDHNGKRVISETDVEPKRLPDYIGKEAAAKLAKKIDEYPTFSEKDYPVEFDDEIGKFVAHDPNGELVRDSGGDVISSSSQTEVERDIEYLIEHERNQVPTPRVSGLDLKVGGDWAKALYDRAIPNFLNKYAKKWSAKVGETQLQGGDTGGLAMRKVVQDRPSGRFRVELSDGELWGSFSSETEAKKAYEQEFSSKGHTVHSIDITPEMKKSVMQTGQPISRNEVPPTWVNAVKNLAPQVA